MKALLSALCLAVFAVTSAANAATVNFSQFWQSSRGTIDFSLTANDLNNDGEINVFPGSSLPQTDEVTFASVIVAIFNVPNDCSFVPSPCGTRTALRGFDLSRLVQFRANLLTGAFSAVFLEGPESAFARNDGASAEIVTFGRYLLTTTLEIPTVVPLPASAISLVSGLLFFGMFRRYRARAKLAIG